MKSNDSRRSQRKALDVVLAMVWQDEYGELRSVEGRALDISEGGARIESPQEVEVNARVSVRSNMEALRGSATVRYCTRRGGKYHVGLQYSEAPRRPERTFQPNEDFYEILQISPNAMPDTIQRVYRILAARYHPDNPDTGQTEKFLLLRRAYEVLSDIDLRAAYDEFRREREQRAIPGFGLNEFLDDVQAEPNRRVGILYLLYRRRRIDADNPGLSLLDFEQMMSLPREHLVFSLWYLKEKGHVRIEESSAYAITSEGVDSLESSLPSHPVLQKLIEAGKEPRAGAAA